MDSDFLYLVEAELALVRGSFPEAVGSSYEARCFIADEVEALRERIRKQGRDTSGVLENLVQIAAMCYRAAEDLQLVGFSPESEWLKSPDDSSKPFVRVGEWQGPLDEREPQPHQWCQEHKGKRFRADDPNQEKLGMAINYKCLHGVEWTVTGACFDALRLEQFNHCDCQPPWPSAEEVQARLKRLDIVDDRRIEQKTEDGDLQPDEEFCGVEHWKHSINSHSMFNGCKVKDCGCWQFCRLKVEIASQR